MRLLFGIIIALMFLVSGCSSYDPAIKECSDKGTFQGKNYCSDCSKGVPYIVAAVCVIEAAEKISEVDKDRALRICEQWADLSINTYSQGAYGKMWKTLCVDAVNTPSNSE